MKLEEALEQAQYTDRREAIIRVCMFCDKPLDRKSEVIMESRDKVLSVLSHGAHDECADDPKNMLY